MTDCDVPMDCKNFRVRADLVVGLVVIAGSLVVAISMHRTDRNYSRLKAPCPVLQIGYPVIDMLGVVAARLEGVVIGDISGSVAEFLRITSPADG
jgi:hypothetical protein